MPRLVRRNKGRSHWYELDGEQIVGVTGVLDEAIRKKGLEFWSAETTALAAVQRQDEWVKKSQYEAVKFLMKARWEVSDRAKANGTDVHTMAEKLLAGETVDVPEAQEGYVDAAIAFIREWQVEVVHSELSVACTATSVPYAGTLDLIADLGGERWLLDWKTGKGVYGDFALQLAAYRFCDLAVIDGADAPMPAVDRVGVVHLRADGYDLVPITAEKPEWYAFLHALQVRLFVDRQDGCIGAALQPQREIA